MNSIRAAIENTVSISLFNRGLAGQVFEDVRRSGAKVVMKNNAAECVLLSPEAYLELMDEVNDARLLSLAAERMARFDPASLVPLEEVDREFGFSQEEAAGPSEVDLE